MAELFNEKQLFDVALGATILIWTIIGVAYCKLVLGNQLVR